MKKSLEFPKIYSFFFKAMFFQIVMYGCEIWTIKQVEHRRIDAFELWCWRRLLRVPCLARRSNQSILKEISPEYLLEGLILKLKLQYFGHLIRRTNSLEKLERLKAGGKGDHRGWDGWMALLTRWTWVEQAPGVGDGQGGLTCDSPWDHKESDTTERQNWAELNWTWNTQVWGLLIEWWVKVPMFSWGRWDF